MMNSTDVPLVDQVIQLLCIVQQPKFYTQLTESVKPIAHSRTTKTNHFYEI